MMLNIVMADDDPIIVHGLDMILSSQDDMQIVGTFKNGQEVIEYCRNNAVDVALLDIRMPVMDGIEAARILLEEKLCAPLLLTTFDEPQLIGRALDVGARGYILKNSPAERILSAIRTVSQGGTVFAPDILDYIRTIIRIPQMNYFDGLTAREMDVVKLIARGLSNAQIAQELFISNGTVRNHISTILEKTQLEHRTQIAVRFYAGNIDTEKS